MSDELENVELMVVKGQRSGKGEVLVLACGALAREIVALLERNRLDHISLHCLPAKLHLHPEQITPRVEAHIKAYRSNYKEIYVAYADCGTGGLLAQKCRELGVEMIQGPHCYSFFESNEVFDKNEDELGTFYLTDFLVKQFDAFVWRPMGLDRHPELLEMYFGNYTKMVYQAQLRDPELEAKARICAERLGLEYEYRFTGYGDLEGFLEQANAQGR